MGLLVLLELLAPSSPDHFSMLTLCFPDEVDGYRVPFNPIDLIDSVVLPDKYHDEMLMMDMDKMVGHVLREPTLAFKLSELFEVFTIKHIKDASLILTLEVPTNVTIVEVVFKDVVSPYVVESGTWTHHFLLMCYRDLSPISMMYSLFHLSI